MLEGGGGMFGALILISAAAAPPPAAEAKAEEIIVTGERVKRALKDTPSSVYVVTARELTAMPADRLEQVLAGIPNVQVGSGSQGPTIRGQDSTGVLNNLAAFLGGTRARATLEVDGRAVGFQEFVFGSAPLWDVDQIEVFRSPLTVTHGRNSIGGGIVVTTKDPTYGWEGSARVIAGNFSTREASAAISGPVLTDQIAFRLTGDIRHSRTTARLADLMRGADPNEDDHSLLRFKLLGQPGTMPGLKVVATFTHGYSQASQAVQVTRPFRRRKFPFGFYGIFGVEVSAATVRATQKLSDGVIDAIVSIGDTHTRRFAEAGLGQARAHLTDLSGETFGSWKATNRLTLRGGVNALNSSFLQRIDLRNFIGSTGDFHDRQRSFGLFGEAEFALTQRLTISGGGRYQNDSQRRIGGLVGAVTAPIVFNGRFSAFLPKVTASYELAPSLNAGLLVQRAYNPGGATLDIDTGGLDTFKAEHLWDYEAFVKGDLPGGHVSVEANLFVNSISNAQREVLVTVTAPNGERIFAPRFNNVPKASTRGAEVALNWHPSPTLTLSGGVGLLNTRILGGENSVGDLIGREFQGAPHLTGSAAADWMPTKRLRLSAQLHYHSRYFSDDFDTPELRIGSAAIVDARVAYTVGIFTAFASARNVFNSFHLTVLRVPNAGEADDPRMVGLGLEARF